MMVRPMTAIKRLVTSALTALILAASVYPCFAAYPTVSSPTPHYRRVGSGEDAYYEIDYYTVSSAAQLRGLASLLSPAGPVYITADIWLNPDDNPTETEFVPIGGENRAFVGTIDGMGHTIHNLYINQPDRDSTGLIGRMTGSISNITVTGSVTGHTDAAGIVGYLDRGAISNVTSKVTVNGYLEVGGVVGYAGGSVTSSENYGTVTATYGAGGVAGSSSAAITDCDNYGNISVTETAAGGVTSASSGTLTTCRNYGTVDSTQQSGGVVGALNGQVTGCVNYGTITGDFYIGGISSRIYTGGKISQCYNYGHIEAKNMAGGVAGYNEDGTIDDCHNRKEIIANIMVAGIAGYNKGIITNCTSTGKITAHATEYTGGIAGENDGQIDDSYFEEGSADSVTGSEDSSSGTETDSGVKDDAWFGEHYPADQEPGETDNPDNPNPGDDEDTPGGEPTKETIIISENITIGEHEKYSVEEDTNVVIPSGVTVTDKGTLENNDTVTIKNQGTLVIEVTGEITGGGVIIVEDGGKVINNSGKPVTVTDEEGNTTEIQPGESHTEDNPAIKPDKILETDTTIPEGETYPVAPDESLVIPDDVTLTVEGTLDNDGTTTVQDGGTIHVTDTGTITGGGTIVVQPGGTIINDGKTEFIVVTGNGGTETVSPGQSYTDQPQIYVIAQSDTGGSISPAGKITVNYGGSLTFNIKPQSGCYEIENVAVNGIAVGAVSSYTMSDIKESSTIQAFFKKTGTDGGIYVSDGGSGCNATHASAALAPCTAALAAAAALRRKKDK